MTPSLPPATNPDGRSLEKTGSRLVKYGGIAALVLVGGASGFGLTYLVQPSGIGSATGITALLTVAAALLGVVLTNQHNANRQSREIKANSDSQRNQLAHDRELAQQSMLADRDLNQTSRDMAFRKELYTDAFGAASEICAHTTDFLDAKRDVSDVLQVMNAPRVSIGKVRLIGDDTTTALAETFLLRATEFASVALPLHHKLRLGHLNIEAAERRATFFEEQMDLHSKVADTLQNTHAPSSSIVEAKQKQQYWNEEHRKQHEKIVDLIKEEQLVVRSNGSELRPKINELNAAGNALLVSMRRELKAK